MFYIQCDWETSERAGAAGCFQVIRITTDEGKDLTDKIDQGKHYRELAEVIVDLGFDPNKVDFEEDN